MTTTVVFIGTAVYLLIGFIAAYIAWSVVLWKHGSGDNVTLREQIAVFLVFLGWPIVIIAIAVMLLRERFG